MLNCGRLPVYAPALAAGGLRPVRSLPPRHAEPVLCRARQALTVRRRRLLAVQGEPGALRAPGSESEPAVEQV